MLELSSSDHDVNHTFHTPLAISLFDKILDYSRLRDLGTNREPERCQEFRIVGISTAVFKAVIIL